MTSQWLVYELYVQSPSITIYVGENVCLNYIYIYKNIEVYRTKYGNEQDIHYARNVTNSLCNFTEFFAQGLNL